MLGKEVVFFMPSVFQNGGIESFMANASLALDREDVHLIILKVSNTKTIYESVFDKTNTNIICLSERCVSKAKTRQLLYRFLTKHRSCIFHIHWHSDEMYLYALIARIAGVKTIICHTHSMYTQENTPNIIKRFRNRFFYELTCNIPSERIACSRAAGIQVYRNKSFICMNNCIDINRFAYNDSKRSEMRARYGIDANTFVIGQIGRFTQQKNYFFTIQILKDLLSETTIDLCVFFIGDGEDKPMIENQIMDNNLSKIVRIVSPNDEIEGYYSLMDCLIMPSKWEAMGIVVIEAQCSGLPVVGSQYIVDEAVITNLCQRKKLQNRVAWKETICRIAEKDRTDRIQMSRDAITVCKERGFDLKQLRDNLTSLYTKYQ